ncbi:conserved hypothetical protein [Weissella viridescens]|uniref:DUF4231 domain-containing protein n=2 Tax=Weissella viridescens TaxID=1629 RepID=A0A0R2H144_WEIVI|nr:DUF4231 domain-containing protein [Weissella viridescens]KRN46559.1 hypothetical protein IV50_GL000837 [Weissella viridescens]GEA94403.1 hypothetical protein WVI01_03260 [Weissella viridescens]SOB42503.1 conserved hypothetical protein [Weissella viridescens]
MDFDNVVASLDAQIKHITKKNKGYIWISNILSMANILLSSSIPILISMAEKNVNLLLMVSIFSALITLVQTFKSTFGLNNKIQNTAMAIAYLKKEKLLFETKTTPYDQDQEENMHMLAQNIASRTDDILDSLKEQ